MASILSFLRTFYLLIKTSIRKDLRTLFWVWRWDTYCHRYYSLHVSQEILPYVLQNALELWRTLANVKIGQSKRRKTTIFSWFSSWEQTLINCNQTQNWRLCQVLTYCVKRCPYLYKRLRSCVNWTKLHIFQDPWSWTLQANDNLFNIGWARTIPSRFYYNLQAISLNNTHK